jgi:hypothetical protein
MVQVQRSLVLPVIIALQLAGAAWAANAATTSFNRQSTDGQEWSAAGDVTYSSVDHSGNETAWVINSANVSLAPGMNYADATVYWRAVVVYDAPGTNSVVWESQPQTSMESGALDPQGGSGNIKSYGIEPDVDFTGNTDKDLIFKVQSGKSTSTGDLDARQVTLQHNVN